MTRISRRHHDHPCPCACKRSRRFKPSAVSRRFSVAAGFYRTCVLDGILQHSPAEHVRRPAVPAESPTLGFTHLQFEALLTAARESANPHDFALVAMLGLPGLRIFEATAADIADLGEEHGHRVLRVCGKGTKIVLVPLPPAVGRAIDRAAGSRVRGRSCLTATAPGWTGTRPPAACGTSPRPPASRSPGPTRTCCATLLSRPVSTQASISETSRSPPATPVLIATRRGHAALGDQGTSPWLFLGGQPGRPISADRLAGRLRQLGLRPSQARSTALFQLATELPAALLARMLGIHISVAVAWPRASSGDWTNYAADYSRRPPAASIDTRGP